MNVDGCLYNGIYEPNISSTLTYLYEVVVADECFRCNIKLEENIRTWSNTLTHAIIHCSRFHDTLL